MKASCTCCGLAVMCTHDGVHSAVDRFIFLQTSALFIIWFLFDWTEKRFYNRNRHNFIQINLNFAKNSSESLNS